MENIYSLRNKIKQAKTQNNWEEVARLSTIIFEEFKAFANIWDKYWFALALFNLKFNSEAEKISQDIYFENSNFSANNILLAKIKIRKYEQKPQIEKAEAFVKTVRQLTDNQYLQAKALVLAGKTLLEKNRPGKAYKLIVKYKDISVPRERFNNQKLSIYEKYCLLVAKVCNSYGKYKTTIKFVSIVDRDKIQPNFLKWLDYYKAIAHSKIGETAEALNILSQLERKGKEWFIPFRMAQIILEDFPQVAKYLMITAIINYPQDSWIKINVYKKLLEIIDDEHIKKKIAQLVVHQYISRKITNKTVNQLIEDFGIKIEDGFRLKREEVEVKKILENYLLRKRFNGEIFSINKGFGFISCNKEKLYFHISQIKFDKKLLEKGLKVNFSIGWNYDIKKEKFSKQCIDIQISKDFEK